MKARLSKRKVSALTLIETLVVVAFLTVLVGFLLPTLARAKKKSSRINCVNNLKQVGLSFRLWATDNGDKFPMQVSTNNGGTMELVESRKVYPHFQVMSNELNTPALLVCPEDPARQKAYRAARESNITHGVRFPGFPSDSPVSYFVGVDASAGRPTMFLTGDAHLAIGRAPVKPGLLSLWTNSPIAWAKPLRPRHGDGGNIGLADGSVRQVGKKQLRELLLQTGVATNRLAIP